MNMQSIMKYLNGSNRHSLEPFIHIISWGLIFFFPILLFGGQSRIFNPIDYLRHCGVPCAFFIVFYTNYLFLVPRLWLKEQRKQYILINLMIVAAVSACLFMYMNLLPKPTKMEHVANPDLFIRLVFSIRDVILLCATAALAAAIRMSQQWSKAEKARQEAEKSRAEAELKNLRNQLNPHFLLNTLNNIYALIAFDSERAQAAVQELSKMLRHVLYDNQQALVSLEKEADFIRNYIELMRIRLPHEVEVKTQFNINSQHQVEIAPLIFISLIENAFKHGISPTEKSFIHIELSDDEKGNVTCRIINSNHPKDSQDRSGSGIGLEQVKKRLELTYPGQYTWEQEVDPIQNTFCSTLIIQTRTHKNN